MTTTDGPGREAIAARIYTADEMRVLLLRAWESGYYTPRDLSRAEHAAVQQEDIAQILERARG